MQVTHFDGFSSFGNNFGNFYNEAAEHRTAVFLPYIYDPNTVGTNFLDPGSCPNTHNKFECAFLPATNCSSPLLTTHHAYYSEATQSAHAISREEFERHVHVQMKRNEGAHTREQVVEDERREQQMRDMTIESAHYGGLAEPHGPTVTTYYRPAYQQLFTFAFLFRLNYNFRGLVALEMARFEGKGGGPAGGKTVDFPRDGQCVTINMRKDPDRAPPASLINVRDFCKNASLGLAVAELGEKNTVKFTNDAFNDFHNFGCQTSNPYGLITLEDFVRGAKQISNATFLYGTTDNARWLDKALQRYKRPAGYSFVPYAAPPNHRRSTTASGVQYLASLLEARKCSSFVGNSGSAVTALYMNLLCVQHQSSGREVFGKCPSFFDFAQGQNVRDFDRAWTTLPQARRRHLR